MSQETTAAVVKGNNNNVTVVDNESGNEVTLPLIGGTEGPPVIDIRSLYAETGYFTYDPGFVATGSCESKITYIDGDAGILLHRGYPIEDLANNSDFLEVCYLLLYGELPTGEQKTTSKTALPTTPCCMSSCTISTAVSGVTRTPWPSCAAWSVPCLPSIMTASISVIQSNGKFPPIA